jgi:pimeloyl-ACP methyl ester carboxylesterase
MTTRLLFDKPETSNNGVDCFLPWYAGQPIRFRITFGKKPTAAFIPLSLLEGSPNTVDATFSKALDAKGQGTASNKIHLVGFSIGAMVAIKIAAAHPDRISRVTLVSPAVPLQLGDFLPVMAGKPVFDLAMRRPGLLRAVTALQGIATRIAPNFLIKSLFAKCGPAERALLEDQTFQTVMRKALSDSFVHHPKAYLGYISAYVEDWRNDLLRINCDVDLWHGTQDTWSPPEMSQALKDQWGERCTLHRVPGTEHYSTLKHVTL